MEQNFLKNSKTAIGHKQTRRAIQNGKAVKIFIALDADEKITLPLVHLCKAHGIEIDFVNSMYELGELCGIEVKASSAVILK